MTATTVKTRPWERREYARIVSVRFHAPRLLVLFADGTEVSVEPERFDNPTIRSQAPDWSRAWAGGHEVVVPAASGEVGIPWDTIRALTDAEFAAHWADLAGGVVREIGIRLRGFRNERGLGIPELARAAGVPVATVTRVEAGEHPIDLGLLDRLLAPLGRTSADLSDEPVASTG